MGILTGFREVVGWTRDGGRDEAMPRQWAGGSMMHSFTQETRASQVAGSLEPKK